MNSLGPVTFPEDAVGSEAVLGALRWVTLGSYHLSHTKQADNLSYRRLDIIVEDVWLTQDNPFPHGAQRPVLSPLASRPPPGHGFLQQE